MSIATHLIPMRNALPTHTAAAPGGRKEKSRIHPGLVSASSYVFIATGLHKRVE